MLYMVYELYNKKKARTICESIIEQDIRQNRPPKLHLPYKDIFYPRGRQMTLPLGSKLKPTFDKEYTTSDLLLYDIVLLIIFT